jgi:hypothetical protein
MGWNPWNAFRTEVTEEKIMSVANVLASSGLAHSGYRYVNIDDGWWLRRRSDNRIEIRTLMFPSAATASGLTTLRPFVDRLHAMGLKAGIYTDIGRNACSQAWDPTSPNLPSGTVAEREVGSMDHQAEDMRQIFGDWNFDFVKVDACGLADFGPDMPFVRDGNFRALGPYIIRKRPDLSDNTRVERLYAMLREAIAAVRPKGDTVLSICTWGEARAAEWGRWYGNQWRTGEDIRPTWTSMLDNFDRAAARPLYAGPGHWNDPDMLEIGNGEFAADHLVEARAHMSLWAIISAPLILGSDLKTWPKSLFDIAGNAEVIAVNQDAAGNQGVVVSKTKDTEVVVKTLAGVGTKAVALINRSEKPAVISVPLSRLNLNPKATVIIRDLWSHEEHSLRVNAIGRELLPHETLLLRVTGRPLLKNGLYLSEIPARIDVLSVQYASPSQEPAGWVPARVDAAPSGEPLVVNGEPFDNGLGVLSNSQLQVHLDKAFRRFRATVGVIGNKGPHPTISYRVYGDGRLLLHKQTATVTSFDLPVEGVGMLKLVTEGATGGDTAIAWSDARVMYKAEARRK